MRWSKLIVATLGSFRLTRSCLCRSTRSLCSARYPNCSSPVSSWGGFRSRRVACFGSLRSWRWEVVRLFFTFCARHPSFFSSGCYSTRLVCDSGAAGVCKFVTSLFVWFSFLVSVFLSCSLNCPLGRKVTFCPPFKGWLFFWCFLAGCDCPF